MIGLVNIKVTRKGLGLSKIAERQVPFATALANTKTVRDAQEVMQRRMPRVFNLRGTQALFERAVKTKPATKTDLKANVRIDGPQSGAISAAARVQTMILRHELGGTHTSDALFRINGRLQPAGFFLPVRGLRTANANVPKKYYPANIGAVLRKDADGSSFFASDQKGRKRKRGKAGRQFSFFATTRGIYERRYFGSGSGLRLIWAFERRITLKPRLGFGETTKATIKARYQANWERALAYALSTAKAR